MSLLAVVRCAMRRHAPHFSEGGNSWCRCLRRCYLVGVPRAAFRFRVPAGSMPAGWVTDDGDALAIQKGAPRTAEALDERLKGRNTRPASTLGFGPSVDRSLPVPPLGGGAPVVDAARGLRKRRRGEVPLNETVNHPAAVAFLADVYEQRPKP